ncbi:hypothetical protein Harman_39520 [Haloarcula mannanilytica]|uniref:HVO-A0261-like N-terminal domain-containing protein n=1 Tax=Haloarcula mannanilytica TaxID=2509225 RepID=A0A4C2EQL6_9EURY|nr:ArsR family transcriptional regulator [Haloarcula mannanilytica]GCF16017.1 hypothetical protein Harman_39520 [Haloarcula mannanilytica]
MGEPKSDERVYSIAASMNLPAEETDPVHLDGPISAYSTAIEDVAFLIRSQHRIHILQLLSEGPQTRDALLTATGASRVTLSRILSDLEDRNWIDRSYENGELSITDVGAAIYEEVAELIETVHVGNEKSHVTGQLPIGWRGLQLRHLVDSEVVVDDAADPMAASRAVADAIAESGSVRVLASTVTQLSMKNGLASRRNGVRPDDQVVFDADATEVCLENDSVTEQWTALESTAETPTFFSYDQPFPCEVYLVDDRTVFLMTWGKTEGATTVIKSENSRVVEWARVTFQNLRSESIALLDCERAPST